jgi:hypothetical protein
MAPRDEEAEDAERPQLVDKVEWDAARGFDLRRA